MSDCLGTTKVIMTGKEASIKSLQTIVQYRKNILILKSHILSLFCYILCLINRSYLEAMQNGEPIGILLRIAKEIDAAPALLARNILEKYCMRNNANGNQ